MRTIPCGFGASTNEQELHLVPSSDLGFCPTFQIWADKHGDNVMKTDPYPHPQHMKIVKHLVYVWSGYENHSMWVLILNQ